MKELKILKLKDLITLQNILFVTDSLTSEGMTSFDKIFQQSTATGHDFFSIIISNIVSN